LAGVATTVGLAEAWPASVPEGDAELALAAAELVEPEAAGEFAAVPEPATDAEPVVNVAFWLAAVEAVGAVELTARTLAFGVAVVAAAVLESGAGLA
jgi:hypothetical protein